MADFCAAGLIWVAVLLNKSRVGVRWLTPVVAFLGLVLLLLAGLPLLAKGIVPPAALEIFAIGAGLLATTGARWPRLANVGASLGVATVVGAVLYWLTTGGTVVIDEVIGATRMTAPVDARISLALSILLGLQVPLAARLSTKARSAAQQAVEDGRTSS